MATRLVGSRATVSVDGIEAEVEAVGAWPIYHRAVQLAGAYFAAADAVAEYAALDTLYTFFCAEAQPTWSILDHRGVIACTPAGMMRLPLSFTLGLVAGWAEAFVAPPLETAVDKLMPPGELRDEMNARLRVVA